MTWTTEIKYTEQQYNGTFIRAVVTLSDFIVSCGDCTNSTVDFYDHDLDLIHTMEVEKTVDSAYEIAAYDQDSASLQTYIAGGDQIKIMLQVTDSKGRHYFNEEETLYTFPYSNSSEEGSITMGKGESYLVFKDSASDVLQIMPACQNNARLDTNSFECVPCDEGTRSWGLQSTECQPCIRIWLAGGTDEYKRALYERLCREGSVKSTILLIAVPILSLALIICLCRNTRDNGWARSVFFNPAPIRKSNATYKAPRGYTKADIEDDHEIKAPHGYNRESFNE